MKTEPTGQTNPNTRGAAEPITDPTPVSLRKARHFSLREQVPNWLETADDGFAFRGLPVLRHDVRIGDESFALYGLHDAADLLDESDFAESFLRDDVAPYGMELWPAALMLAAWILDGEVGNGREVLELGCGMGLVALAAARRGWHVRATDHDPTALQFAELNARENGIDNVRFELLDWKNPPADRQVGLILAADVLYQLVDHGPLLICLDQMLAPNGTALIADPCRGVADRFPERAREAGFNIEERTLPPISYENRTVPGRLFLHSKSSQ